MKLNRVYPRFLNPALVIATILFAPAIADAQTFKLSKGTVKLNVPQAWQDVSNLFGMPLMLLGPEKSGGRPVLSITPTDIKGIQFDEKSLKKQEADYKAGREAWLQKYSGEAVSYNPYHVTQWKGIKEAHVVGYRYKLNDVVFAENSYYVVCKDQLFHLKTLVRADHEQEYSSTIDQTVKSFTCE